MAYFCKYYIRQTSSQTTAGSFLRMSIAKACLYLTLLNEAAYGCQWQQTWNLLILWST